MTRAILPAESNALKTAHKQLVANLGGLEAAASCTRVGKSQLAEYGAVQATEKHAPVDVVLDLERIAGTPLVTEALARLQGYHLLPVEMPGEGDVSAALQLVATDAGATLGDAMRALGGGMDASELLLLQRDLSALVGASQHALALVNRRLERP